MISPQCAHFCMHALYRHCIRPMDAKHIQDIQERVNVNFLGEVRLYNAKITSDVLKGLIFPEDAESIDLSQNQITTLEGVRFPEGLEHLNLSHNQITTLKGVTLPPTVRTLNLSYNPELRLTHVNDLRALGWRKYIPGAKMGVLNLIETKVTLEGDLCFVKNIPENFSIVLNQGTYTNSSRSGNGIEKACVAMTSSNHTFGERVIQSMYPKDHEGGKKRQQAKRQQTKRRQAKRQQTKRRQQKTRRQSKLKK